MVQRKRRSTKKKSAQLNFNFLKPVLLVLIVIAFIYFMVSKIDFVSTILEPNNNETVSKLAVDSAKTIQQLKITDSPTVSERESIRQPQIEILNGCGVSNITDSFRDFFNENNVDVISTGNYVDFKQENSFLIVYSKSHLDLAKKLAMLLHIDESLIREEYQEKPLNELSLVLGKDYGILNK